MSQLAWQTQFLPLLLQSGAVELMAELGWSHAADLVREVSPPINASRFLNLAPQRATIDPDSQQQHYQMQQRPEATISAVATEEQLPFHQ